jgi:6-phosphogluconolactonase
MVFPDADSLAQAAANEFLRISQESIQSNGHFSVALSGGTTPKRLYHLLAVEEAYKTLDWEQIYTFFSDERCVPPQHNDSNFKMANDVLLAHVPIPHVNVHRMRGELNPAKAAIEYTTQLDKFFQPDNGSLPVFDLILLGMGDDGHTASLFPGDAALQETNRWVVSVKHDQPPLPLVTRLTLTLPVINSARNVIFVVAGKSKAGAVQRVLFKKDPLPARLVQPYSGHLLWLLDKEAQDNRSISSLTQIL